MDHKIIIDPKQCLVDKSSFLLHQEHLCNHELSSQRLLSEWVWLLIQKFRHGDKAVHRLSLRKHRRKHPESHRIILSVLGNAFSHGLRDTPVSVPSLHKFSVQISQITHSTSSWGANSVSTLRHHYTDCYIPKQNSWCMISRHFLNYTALSEPKYPIISYSQHQDSAH